MAQRSELVSSDERMFRPDAAARVVLGLLGALCGAIVAAVPAMILVAADRMVLAVGVLAIGLILGAWRTSCVCVTADSVGITVHHAFGSEVIRWKRVERIVADRRLWLPGLVVPTLRLRSDDEVVPLFGASAASVKVEIDTLRQLHGRVSSGWRDVDITAAGPGRADVELQLPDAPAVG